MKKNTNTLEDPAVAPSSDQQKVVGVPFTGILTGFNKAGAPSVAAAGGETRREIMTRSCVPLSEGDIGQEVVVVDDPARPGSGIVLGVVQRRIPGVAVEATADGQQVTLRAGQSITLTCGDASISLKADGTVFIRGSRIVSQSTGVNRIRGASVELN